MSRFGYAKSEGDGLYPLYPPRRGPDDRAQTPSVPSRAHRVDDVGLIAVIWVDPGSAPRDVRRPREMPSGRNAVNGRPLILQASVPVIRSGRSRSSSPTNEVGTHHKKVLWCAAIHHKEDTKMAHPPAPIVTAPEPGPRRYGLFTVASGPLDMPAHGEGSGVTYISPACGESHAVGIDCPAPDELPEPDGDNDLISSGVFSVRSALECGQVGQTEAELRTKLTRRLEASEQATVEAAFATGLDYDGAPLDALNLDDVAEPVDATYDPASIRSVVGALLAQAAADYGFRPTLHASASVEPYAAAAGLIVADGPFLRTPTGALWSFGNYPAGELFVSGQVTIWRASTPAVTSVFDRETNVRLMVAERAYALGIDCGWAGRADLTPLGS